MLKFPSNIQEYEKEINKELNKLVGMCLDDLPDCPTARWFQERVIPMQAARRAIANAKEY